MREQAQKLLALGARAVLIKGGHGGGPESVDLLVDARGCRAASRRRGSRPKTPTAPAARCRPRSRRDSPRDCRSTRPCARPRLSSPPRSPRRTGSASAQVTGRCTIFTSGGKFALRGYRGAARSRYVFAGRSRPGGGTAMLQVSRAAGGRGHCSPPRRLLLPLRGQEAVAARRRQALRQRGRARNQPGLDAEIPRGAQGRRRGDDQGARHPGIRQLGRAKSDKNHVFIFEVFNDAAAWDAHREDRGLREVHRPRHDDDQDLRDQAVHRGGPEQEHRAGSRRPTPRRCSSISTRSTSPTGRSANSTTRPMTHAAASVQDAGCREFDIAVSQTKGSHVLLLSAFDAAAALAAPSGERPLQGVCGRHQGHHQQEHRDAAVVGRRADASDSEATSLRHRRIDQLAGAPAA